MAVFTSMPQARIAELSSVTDGSAAPAVAVTVLLVDDTHDFDAAVLSSFVSDIVSDELVATNYARQGLVYATAITIDSDGRAVITFTDTDFGLLGGAVNATVGGCYIFDSTGNDATSRLLWSVPATRETTDGTQFVIRWSSPTVAIAG